MSSFSEMAAVKTEDLPEVKLMPRGSYMWKVIAQPEVKPSASGASTLINFKVKCMGAIDDFEDPDALEEYGTPTEVRTIMFTFPEMQSDSEDAAGLERRRAASIQRLRKFLVTDLGVEDDGAATIQQLLGSCVNHTCLGVITWEPDNRDPSVMRDRIGQTAPIV